VSTISLTLNIYQLVRLCVATFVYRNGHFPAIQRYKTSKIFFYIFF